MVPSPKPESKVPLDTRGKRNNQLYMVGKRGSSEEHQEEFPTLQVSQR
jgi:hypothetical protein